MNRAWRKRFGFGAAKGLAVRLFDFILHFRNVIPRFVFVAFLHSAVLFFKLTWFLPFHPWRRNARNVLKLGGAGETPRRMFYRLVDGCVTVALLFLDAHRKGVRTVLPSIRITPMRH